MGYSSSPSPSIEESDSPEGSSPPGRLFRRTIPVVQVVEVLLSEVIPANAFPSTLNLDLVGGGNKTERIE